jgi:hypothetical protein
MSGLKGIMANRGAASKAHRMGNLHVPHAGRATLKAAKLTAGANLIRPLDANSARRTRATRIRFRFVPILTIVTRRRVVDSAAHCLWMDSAPGCADSANHIS